MASARPERAAEQAAPITRQVRVDAAQDPSASGTETRGVRLSRASTTVLVLPASGVYRVALRPQGGRALVRLWHRRDVPVQVWTYCQEPFAASQSSQSIQVPL